MWFLKFFPFIQYDGLKKQYKINIIILYQLPFILNFCLAHETPFSASLTDSYKFGIKVLLSSLTALKFHNFFKVKQNQ